MSSMQTTRARPGKYTMARAKNRGDDRRSPGRYLVPLLGLVAFLFTAMGLSGLGDAPAPHDTAESMSAHFQEVDDAIRVSAPLGTLGAAALAAFVVAFARRLHRHGQTVAAALVATGAFLAAGYFIFIHVVYTTLADSVAATSPEVTKGMFVATILAVPVLGLGVAVALGGAAYGSTRAGLLPRWWSVLSGVGAAVAAVAIFSYADSDYFSPDVQQQVVGGVLQLWVVITAVVLAIGIRRGSLERPAGP